jgi:hypothetical protein
MDNQQNNSFTEKEIMAVTIGTPDILNNKIYLADYDLVKKSF